MTITIIIATRNAEAHLQGCLNSIVEQSVLPFQVVVQDGQSTDGTIDILHDYQEKLGVILDWESEPDSGIAEAWNRALKRARGSWILFLGSDDMLYGRESLQRASCALAHIPPNIRVAYGRVLLCSQEGLPLSELGREWADCSRDFRRCIEFIPHQGTFHHHSLFDELGQFDPSFAIGCDYDYLLRELMSNNACYLGPAIVTRMLIGGVSTSRRYILRVNLERIRLHGRHVGSRAPALLYWNVFKAFCISLLYRFGGDDLARRSANLYRKWIVRKSLLLK